MKMKSFVLSLAAALMIACGVGARAQVGPSISTVLFNGQNNPCANPSIPQSHVVVALSAGTTQLVAPVTGAKVHVCMFMATFAGTTPAMTFINGTQTTTACDTGATNLSGAFLPTSGTFVSMAPVGSSVVTSLASAQVCALVVGSVQGVLTYVQQ